jgi:hypothetical protein
MSVHGNHWIESLHITILSYIQGDFALIVLFITKYIILTELLMVISPKKKSAKISKIAIYHPKCKKWTCEDSHRNDNEVNLFSIKYYILFPLKTGLVPV